MKINYWNAVIKLCVTVCSCIVTSSNYYVSIFLSFQRKGTVENNIDLFHNQNRGMKE